MDRIETEAIALAGGEPARALVVRLFDALGAGLQERIQEPSSFQAIWEDSTDSPAAVALTAAMIAFGGRGLEDVAAGAGAGLVGSSQPGC